MILRTIKISAITLIIGLIIGFVGGLVLFDVTGYNSVVLHSSSYQVISTNPLIPITLGENTVDFSIGIEDELASVVSGGLIVYGAVVIVLYGAVDGLFETAEEYLVMRERFLLVSIEKFQIEQYLTDPEGDGWAGVEQFIYSFQDSFLMEEGNTYQVWLNWIDPNGQPSSANYYFRYIEGSQSPNNFFDLLNFYKITEPTLFWLVIAGGIMVILSVVILIFSLVRYKRYKRSVANRNSNREMRNNNQFNV